ncbi:MAG: VOC family protein [Gammaproteobacteria bacterium]|nr:VOC family protein [Gammaproteobacteria bacterium]MCY4357510.1 VOC family protein [Gammaproteobacteria bacterium]
MNAIDTQVPFSGFSSRLSRRQFLQTVPMLLITPMALAQNTTPVAVRAIHNFGIRVRDVDTSVQFYQDLFGAPIQVRRDDSVFLRVGNGPRFFSISPAAMEKDIGFTHIGLSVANFDVDLIRQQLVASGIRSTAAPGGNENGLDLASRSWVVNQNGIPELFFADIEGLVYQLSNETYCGGGVMTDPCILQESVPSVGMFQLVDYSHFTNFVANRTRANNFYTTTFGKAFQAYQGPGSPIIGVGNGVQFLMYVGGEVPGDPVAPARIDHVCFSVVRFDVEDMLTKLTDYGLSARQGSADIRPLMHWVSMRMPNRGGAPQGTPELYFTDPDGIRIQLQDPGYCGGTGYLGDSCPSLA